MSRRLSALIIILIYLFVIDECQTEIFQLSCQSVDPGDICYTLHTGQLLNQSDADAECHRLNNGRLVTIFNNSTQTLLDGALRNSSQSSEYWIGATVQYLDKWTWVNNVSFIERTCFSGCWFKYPKQSSANDGYMTLRKIDRFSDVTDELLMNAIAWHDPVIINGSHQALCMCSACENKERFYTRPARRWHEARHICTSLPGNELAALTEDDGRNVFHTMKDNVYYYIGLSKLQVIWKLEGLQSKLATFTNWHEADPVRFGESPCVYLSHADDGHWKWATADCNTTKHFICEYERERKPAKSNWTTSSFVFLFSGSHTETGTSAEPPDNSHFVYSWLAVLLAMLLGLIIIFAIVTIIILRWRRKKSKSNVVDNVSINFQRQTCSDQADDSSVYVAPPGESSYNHRSKQRSAEVNKIDRVHDGALVYASILTAEGTRSSMDQTEDNAYEMPVQQVEYASLEFN